MNEDKTLTANANEEPICITAYAQAFPLFDVVRASPELWRHLTSLHDAECLLSVQLLLIGFSIVLSQHRPETPSGTLELPFGAQILGDDPPSVFRGDLQWDVEYPVLALDIHLLHLH